MTDAQHDEADQDPVDHEVDEELDDGRPFATTTADTSGEPTVAEVLEALRRT